MKTAFYSRVFIALSLTILPTSVWAISEKDYLTQYDSTVGAFYATGQIGEFQGVDDVTIQYRVFENPEERGALVIVNGRTETYAKYAEVIYDLSRQGYSIYVYDHRGQGYSKFPESVVKNPLTGYVRHFDDYVTDLKTFVDTVVNAKPHARRFILAHSLGGAVSASYLEKHPNDFDAAVLSAPMLEINTSPFPEWVASAVSTAACELGLGKNFAPGQSDKDLDSLFETNRVTHSLARYNRSAALLNEEPSLRLGGASNRWVQQSMQADRKIRKNARQATTPILLIQAGNDKIVRPAGQKQFCDRAAACKRITMLNAYHEMLMEVDDVRTPVLKQVVDFFENYRQPIVETAPWGSSF